MAASALRPKTNSAVQLLHDPIPMSGTKETGKAFCGQQFQEPRLGTQSAGQQFGGIFLFKEEKGRFETPLPDMFLLKFHIYLTTTTAWYPVEARQRVNFELQYHCRIARCRPSGPESRPKGIINIRKIFQS